MSCACETRTVESVYALPAQDRGTWTPPSWHWSCIMLLLMRHTTSYRLAQKSLGCAGPGALSIMKKASFSAT